MPSLVVPEVAIGCEFFPTFLAFVGSYTSVNSQMHIQVGFFEENLATSIVRALIFPPLTASDMHVMDAGLMYSQSGQSHIASVAHGTLVCAFRNFSLSFPSYC